MNTIRGSLTLLAGSGGNIQDKNINIDKKSEFIIKLNINYRSILYSFCLKSNK
jgi:hypothetical protein